ncbi:MAG: RluA family pseudouridine synthase [Proteobacteria bacterium]|nr:RluA family pseudouridine synthase [Pseudomonadota bacterium]NDC24755.1 RluA family pseudouridine synthase [Pseudomonadota bacterium]NDD03284.1 RluA family pseudouridine synthase [Pseudomonadota bacterium]
MDQANGKSELVSTGKPKYIEGLHAEPELNIVPDLHVLYEDNHLLLVFKPHRLLIQKDSTGDFTLFKQACLWLKQKYSKPGNVYLGLIHRLDRPASGIVIFAKTSKAASRLSEQFRAKTVEKKYMILVEGVPQLTQGKCLNYLSDPLDGRAEVHDLEVPGTKRSEMNYQVIGSKSGISLVEVELLTGRRHQIRAQMAHLGHPIVGDVRYGSKAVFSQGAVALVASSIAFEHPISKAVITFDLPDPLHSVRRYWNEL